VLPRQFTPGSTNLKSAPFIGERGGTRTLDPMLKVTSVITTRFATQLHGTEEI
jgi:hypothetical protein